MKKHKKLTLNRPDIGLRELFRVVSVLRSGNLAQGDIAKDFERRFAEMHGTKYAVVCNSGTSALFLALQSLGLTEGDEVLVPAFTFGATANSVIFSGAKPIFVDVNLDDYNMNYVDARTKITSKTRAIIIVHLYGNPINLPLFNALASEFQITLIQDASQAHLATWEGKPVASFGKLSCFSFYPTKNMTTGEGGMVLTDDEEMCRKMRLIRNQGMSSRYVYEIPGMNLRMTEIAAAIGIEQLRKIEIWTKKRRRNAEIMNNKLNGVFQFEMNAGHVFHQYTIRVPSPHRDGLVQFLSQNGIETDIYYPKSLTEYSIFPSDGILPNSSRLSREVISIPIHQDLKRRDIVRIANLINEYYVQVISKGL